MSRVVLHLWAARHKQTGEMLPAVGDYTRGGFTYHHLFKPEEMLPRLHTTEKSAMRCLQIWLKGKRISEHDDGATYYKRTVRVPERNPEMMEVVPVTLIIGEHV